MLFYRFVDGLIRHRKRFGSSRNHFSENVMFYVYDRSLATGINVYKFTQTSALRNIVDYLVI